ncbi:MAG: hypothetical protein A2Z47_12870 [Thermodesulfovibrio sp. RBG_19FT_COMBO_42_12]|nr:MAG: hypothetical protein A2Z47_12870 [Thermodesulfovibrio sp. RBG_19FT_COMBO_42_12]
MFKSMRSPVLNDNGVPCTFREKPLSEKSEVFAETISFAGEKKQLRCSGTLPSLLHSIPYTPLKGIPQ